MADNKKTYSIVINGIQESVKAVDSLNDALGMLEQKIKNLEQSKISVSNTSSSSSSSSRASSLQQEDKLLKQIQSTEQQIKDARREDYQQLLAQKDILKDITNEQKERAASERLVANNYGNTMQGMKQQLSDIKSVMQTTDIGSDKFQELTKTANELNTKLKEVEATYGQFGRNVGNYGGGGINQEFQALKIEVNGVTREFGSAREALRTLTNERNTLKLMGEDVGELDTVVKTLKSDINDMDKSSAAMDNLLDSMQGLLAIASTAKGFGALFGMDDSAIEQSIQKLVALQNVLQGIETIKKQWQESAGIIGLLKKSNAAVDKFAASLLGVGTNAKAANVSLKTTAAATTAVGTASKAATVAVKALSLALKTVGIGLAITAIGYLVQAFEDWLSKESEVEKAQKRLAEVHEQGARAYAKAKGELMLYQSKLESFNGTKKQEETLVNELNTKYGQAFGIYKSVYEWKKKIVELSDAYCQALLLEAEAQELLNQYTDAYKEYQQALYDDKTNAKDTWFRSKYHAEIQEAVGVYNAKKKLDYLRDEMLKNQQKRAELIKKYKLFDYSNYEDEIKKTGATVGKTVKDIENDIAKMRIDAMKQGFVKTLAQLSLERDKRIEEAKKSGKLVQEQILAINSLYNQKMLDARMTYHRQMLSEEKKFQEEIGKVQEATWRRAYENSVKGNEQLKDDRLKNIVDHSNWTEAKMLTIDYDSSDVKEFWGKYNEDAVKAYINTRNWIEAYKKSLKDLDKFDVSNAPDDVKKLYEDTLSKTNKELEEAEAQMAEIKKEYQGIDAFVENTSIVSEKLSEAFALRYQWRLDYYQKVLNAEILYADKEKKIEQNRIDTEIEMLEKEEKKRHELLASRMYDDDISDADKKTYETPRSALSVYQQAYANLELMEMDTNQIGKYFSDYNRVFNDWLDNLKRGYEEGKVSAEEYFSIIDSTALKSYMKQKDEYSSYLSIYNSMTKENQAKNKVEMDKWTQAMNNAFVSYLDTMMHEQDNYKNAIDTIDMQWHYETEAEEKAHLDRMHSATKDYHSNLIQEYDKVLSSISSKIDKAEKRSKVLGIIDYSKTKKNLNDLKETAEETLREITKQKLALTQQFLSGGIGFDDYDRMMSQLKTIETQVTDTLNDINNKSKGLMSNFIGSVAQILSALGSSLNNLVGAIGDYTNQQFENQIKALEDHIDEYEELLNKQKEITEKHASEVNSAEEELKDARGSRREALIDKLNAEMEKQRESLAEEKRIENEKERLEKEKEAKEKEKLEAQKKVQLSQAIIAGAVAFMNALATQPFWVGMAMATMTAAMTAVQIATIESQKYAQGGVIEGKSHAQGGVKVLGGRAEVEGGEYITNKTTTAKNVDLLEYINSKRRKVNLDDMLEFYSSGKSIKKNINLSRTKFANGGQIPQLRNDIDINDRLLTAFEDYSNRPQYVAVVDIMDRMDSVNKIQVMAGLQDD